MLIVFSITITVTPAAIVKEIEPLPNEPVVQSGVDKFYGTNLEKILTQRSVRTLIITGTAAHGAVLETATAAALRGFKVVIPVDGISADNLYAEQYTAWHLVNSPGTRNQATLTKSNLIKY